MGVKTQWSQDIPVGGDKMKETRLLKVCLYCHQAKTLFVRYVESKSKKLRVVNIVTCKRSISDPVD